MPTDGRTLTLAPAEIGDRLRPYRHTALLVAIIALLAVRPLVSSTGAGPALYSIAIMLVLMVALYTLQVDELVGDRELLLKQRKHRAVVGWVLAIVAIALRLAIIVSPSHELATIGGISWLSFFAYVTLTELRGVLKQKRITRESISMSVSVYLLLGLTWGLFYILLFDLQPQAFNFGSAPAPSGQQVTPVLIYFSLTTLATVGYGDITPATLQARYAAVSEGIAGQFYLAILVARLVGMQMSQASIQQTEDQNPEPDADQPGAKD
jgi:voltage-gated potassium channel